MEVLTELTREQLGQLEKSLSDYDNAHMPGKSEGAVRIGIMEDGRLLAGLDACITSYRTMYVSTVFVAEDCRGKGLGRRLMAEMERRARAMGALLIRLDTFDWQGTAFYRALGYEEVGRYDAPEAGFSESFFLKRLAEQEVDIARRTAP